MASELAEFYGINPFQLSPEQKLGLWANLPQMKARRRLQTMLNHRISCESADEVYDLVFAASQDQDLAEKAWHEFRRAELRAGITPKG